MIVSITYAVVCAWLFWLIYSGVVNLNLINNRKQISLKLQLVDQERSFATFHEMAIPSPQAKNSRQQAKSSNSQAETWQSHFSTLQSLMLDQHLYRNEDLSVSDLAEKLSISPGYVAQIIKKHTNKNVTSWINEFRVTDAKKMLTDSDFQNYTTLAIGLESGFKSKSSFYATFKKVTGTTPASFRSNQS